MNRRFLQLLAVVLGCGLIAVVLIYPGKPGASYEMAPGDTRLISLSDYGHLKLDVSAGQVTVVPGEQGHVRLTLQRLPGNAHVWERIRGDIAELHVDHLGNNASLVIEVPPHTDLDVNLSAGELKVLQVAGNKDLDVRAGRVEVENASSEYGRASAFVLSGRIAAPMFGNETGGLWRSRQWRGKGHSELAVSVLAGEVVLKTSNPAKEVGSFR